MGVNGTPATITGQKKNTDRPLFIKIYHPFKDDLEKRSDGVDSARSLSPLPHVQSLQ